MDNEVSHNNTKRPVITEVQPVDFKTERLDHDTDSESSGDVESPDKMEPPNSPCDVKSNKGVEF